MVEKIDSRIPVANEKGAKTTIGQRVSAIILNGLEFTDDRLYLFKVTHGHTNWFSNLGGSTSWSCFRKKILKGGASQMHAFCHLLKSTPTFL